MSKPPASVALWMPFFIKEHRALASTMSHPEHSAFCYLQMLLWENDGSIADDDRLLSRHLRLTTKQWKAMRDAVLVGCTVAAGIISHAAMIDEIGKAKANVEQKRKAGMASAAARKAGTGSNGRSTAVATESQQNGNRTPTARQPYAGSGEGEGYLPRDQFLGEVSSAREDATPFRVIGGAK